MGSHKVEQISQIDDEREAQQTLTTLAVAIQKLGDGFSTVDLTTGDAKESHTIATTASTHGRKYNAIYTLRTNALTNYSKADDKDNQINTWQTLGTILGHEITYVQARKKDLVSRTNSIVKAYTNWSGEHKHIHQLQKRG